MKKDERNKKNKKVGDEVEGEENFAFCFLLFVFLFAWSFFFMIQKGWPPIVSEI